jgi:signal peptidase I
MASTTEKTKVEKEKTDNKKSTKPKSVLREWIETIVFAVTVASLVHWLIMQPYTIPTPSMEKSLLVGDFLFVSKFHYGARTSQTPLHVPLTDNRIWGTNIPSYTRLLQLPSFRLPGISSIKNNDVVVFNYPPDEANPTDLKTHYIKRCIGIAGDSLKIVNKQVFINGKELLTPVNGQTSYVLQTKQAYSGDQLRRALLKLDITDINEMNSTTFDIKTSAEKVAKLKELEFTASITEQTYQGEQPGIFPGEGNFKWSVDNFGPLYIPKKGVTIPINASNLAFYKDVILKYDHNNDAKIENGKLYLDGKEVTQYTFNQNYYWMMGDNRHNSEDSRFWGFVPEDHVVGKALFIWWSVDYNKGWGNPFTKIRWNRIFNGIN